MPRGDTASLLALVLGTLHIFWLACLSASRPPPWAQTPGALSPKALQKPVSGPEDVHSSDHVLPADGAFVHALAALGTRDHVAALQQNTVDGRVHADPTQVLLQAGRHCSPWTRQSESKET